MNGIARSDSSLDRTSHRRRTDGEHYKARSRPACKRQKQTGRLKQAGRWKFTPERSFQIESIVALDTLAEHDLLGKSVSTFPDQAPSLARSRTDLNGPHLVAVAFNPDLALSPVAPRRQLRVGRRRRVSAGRRRTIRAGRRRRPVAVRRRRSIRT